MGLGLGLLTNRRGSATTPLATTPATEAAAGGWAWSSRAATAAAAQAAAAARVGVRVRVRVRVRDRDRISSDPIFSKPKPKHPPSP